MSDPLPQQLGSTLGSAYSIERELGGGGMSRVFVARDATLGRDVVVKVLSQELSAGISAARFAREIQLAARLQHPHIVPLLTAGETDGLPYYTMPFIRGDSLRARMERGPIPMSEAVEILRDMAEALAYAHAEGVIHRDIKPENVLLSSGGAIVTDFGVAKAVSDSAGAETSAMLTEVGMNIGTPAYMSPEQVSGDTVDARTDIYAWGVVAYEVLSHAHPFAGKTSAQSMFAAQVAERPALLASKAPGVSRELAAVVMQCLEKDRNIRPESAADLVAKLGQIESRELGAHERRVRARRMSLVAAGLLVIAGSASAYGWKLSRERWAHGKAIEELNGLIERERFDSAYVLADKALSILPTDSAVRAAASGAIVRLSLASSPVGAKVYRQMTVTTDTSRWDFVGISPIDSARVPRGMLRLRIEHDGFRPYFTGRGGTADTIRLRPSDSARVGEYVPVRGGPITSPGLPGSLAQFEGRTVGRFSIGRYEVTNVEFKRFVAAGGYSRRELWDDNLLRAGQRIAWGDAMPMFVDRTKRPGPSTWELGGYPAGDDEFPVAGVSWYEARAYARFAGKQLPTLYHWVRAANLAQATAIVPASNVQTKVVAKVGSFRGMTPIGAFDMAGNVREWSLNAIGNDRLILGGAWDDPPYMFMEANHLDPFDRSPENGFRLASYSAKDEAAPALTGPVLDARRDFTAERPATDDVFAVYRRLYDYDPAPLDARIERTDTTAESIRERVSFAAAYGNERMIAYYVRPRVARGRLQTVIHFPIASAIHSKQPASTEAGEWVIKSGRAFLLPIYKGTFERSDEISTDYPDMSTNYRDHVIAWGKDLRRTLDYVVTRGDVDSTRLAFYGMSWGGGMGGIMMAIEPRLKAALLRCPGLYVQRSQPEVDAFNFLPRVQRPVLMVGGRYDAVFPLIASQTPMFELLGTPAAQKRHAKVDSGHCPSEIVFDTEALPWLDRYLGPVP